MHLLHKIPYSRAQVGREIIFVEVIKTFSETIFRYYVNAKATGSLSKVQGLSVVAVSGFENRAKFFALFEDIRPEGNDLTL
jgi:hypothetical protein